VDIKGDGQFGVYSLYVQKKAGKWGLYTESGALLKGSKAKVAVNAKEKDVSVTIPVSELKTKKITQLHGQTGAQQNQVRLNSKNIRSIIKVEAFSDEKKGPSGMATGGLVGAPLALFYSMLMKRGVSLKSIQINWAPPIETFVFQVFLVGGSMTFGYINFGIFAAALLGLIASVVSLLLFSFSQTHPKVYREGSAEPEAAEAEDFGILATRSSLENLAFFSLGLVVGALSGSFFGAWWFLVGLIPAAFVAKILLDWLSVTPIHRP